MTRQRLSYRSTITKSNSCLRPRLDTAAAFDIKWITGISRSCSHILNKVFPGNVAESIRQMVLNSQYQRQQQLLLTWPYRGWTRCKPAFYHCPEGIWRRMPLKLQDSFLPCGDPNPNAIGVVWIREGGMDLEDFEEYRTQFEDDEERAPSPW